MARRAFLGCGRRPLRNFFKYLDVIVIGVAKILEFFPVLYQVLNDGFYIVIGMKTEYFFCFFNTDFVIPVILDMLDV